MKVLFSINHPSQYHSLKNLAKNIVNLGGEVVFFIQERGMIGSLAANDGFQYCYSVSPKLRKYFKRPRSVAIRALLSIIQQEFNILKYNLFNKVDFMIGSDIAIAHVGFLMRRKTFIFADDDYVFIKPFCHMVYPFATHIVASKVVDVHKWSHKKIWYHGTQKGSYLHPDYFSPDATVLDRYNLRGTRYFILRLVNFVALHDVQHGTVTGIGDELLKAIIDVLKEKGRIILNLEDGLRSNYAEYVTKIAPKDMHSLMYYADLLVGDSQSMHIEAALLGTPSIRSNKWVTSRHKMSVIDYLETKYRICFSIAPSDTEGIINQIQSLLQPGTKGKWQELRKQYFQENTNLTDFISWIIGNYPKNLEIWKQNSDIVDKFK